MRPESARLTSRAASVARARLVVKADLGWFPGYVSGEVSAAGVVWRIPAGEGRPARDVTIDRPALHRATRALKELELRFPDVAPQVAPRAWRAGVARTLELLKPMVHRGSIAEGEESSALVGYPAQIVAEIRTSPDVLRTVLRAATWICLPTPARLARMVTWALENVAVVQALAEALDAPVAERTAVSLMLLADEVGSRHVEALARLLGNASLFTIPTTGEEYAARLVARVRGAHREEARPPVTLGASLVAWTSSLLVADGRARRRGLALLSAIDLAPVLSTWDAWWSRVDACERAARGAVEGDRHELHEAAARNALVLKERVPCDLPGKRVVEMLARASTWDDVAHREALRALAKLPEIRDGASVRIVFFRHWISLGESAKPRALGEMLRAFTGYLARAPRLDDALLIPWAWLLKRRRPGRARPPEPALLAEAAPAKWALYFEARARLVEAAPSADHTALLRAVLPLSKEALRLVALARALDPEVAYDDRSLQMAFDLSEGDSARFGVLASAIARTASGSDVAHLLCGIAAIRKAWGDATARALLVEDGAVLLRVGRRLGALAMLGCGNPISSPALHADHAWTSAYPAWLAEPLRALAEVAADASRIAARLLGDNVRTASAVRRELAHLERVAAASEVAPARVVRRIEGLRARLGREENVPPARRARLVAKLANATRRAQLATVTGAVDAALRAHLPVFLGIDDAPSWLFEDRTLDKLTPIWRFEPAMRRLAARVFRLRAGAPPWDLRFDARNALFLDHLTRASVNVRPWVDGIGTRRFVSPDGVAIDLRLEDDPLEILDMGRHFSTCLAPQSVNYFSAFANAADINKRVLYARDVRGAVVGRCLFALTAAGGLLAFHPYAHDSKIEIEALVKAFLEDLAAQMGIAIVPRGEVPRLVAPDWYDDGPIDLGERFAFLELGSPFRRSIVTMAPEAFVEEAARAFAPLPLGEMTLPLLVELQELDANPKVVVPLLPRLEALHDLPLSTLVRAAELFVLAGERDAIGRTILGRIVRLARAARHDEHGWLERALAVVVELAPSEALRVLLATRRRGVRGWIDEADPMRLTQAARAYEALRRPRRAAALYRCAAQHERNARGRRALLARAETLDALGVGGDA